MAAQACEPTIYEIAIIHVRPGHIYEFLTQMQKGKELMERHGQKTLGMWISEAGTAGTIYILKEYASVCAKLKAKESLLKDPEAHAYFKATGPLMACAQSFVCKKPPPPCEMKPINPKAPVVIHKLIPKKFKFFAAHHHYHVIDHMSKIVPPEVGHHIISLFPIMYEEFCFFSIFQIGENKVDEAYNMWVSLMRDPKNWAHMAASEEVYTDQMNVLCTPIDFSKLPACK